MKRNIYSIIIAISVVLFFVSCQTEKIPRGERYAQLYEEQPLTLLIMPPINKTTHVEAKEMLYSSMSKPLIDAGYYVISPVMALDIMKAESAYDAELFINTNLDIFKTYFGADAVVFTEIGSWQKKGIGIQTNIRCIIKSTKTNNILFERCCDLFLDMTPNSSASNNTSTSLIDLLTAVVKTATTDPIVAARKANAVIFGDIPYGKYSPQFLMDKEKISQPKEVKTSVK